MRWTLGLLLVALWHAPLASAVYKCVDENGRTLFGDVPPAACAKVPIYQVSPSGLVLKRIDPTPTAQQVELQREERERHAKEARIAAEQRRKDLALLNSFGSAAEFDVARDRNIEPISGRITAAQDRIRELDQREAQLTKQAQAFTERVGKDGQPGEAPAWMVEDLQRVRDERSSLRAAIGRFRKEIEEVRVRFDTDKKRWVALKSGEASLAPEPAPARSEPVKATAPRRRPGYQ
jgi:hypothetical protein